MSPSYFGEVVLPSCPVTLTVELLLLTKQCSSLVVCACTPELNSYHSVHWLVTFRIVKLWMSTPPMMLWISSSRSNSFFFTLGAGWSFPRWASLCLVRHSFSVLPIPLHPLFLQYWDDLLVSMSRPKRPFSTLSMIGFSEDPCWVLPVAGLFLFLCFCLSGT